MKYLTALIFLISCQSLRAQAFIQEVDNSIPKPNYSYILVWREWVQGMDQQGDAISIKYYWRTKFEGFNSKKELSAWLNIMSGWNGEHPSTRITQDQFIAVYELATGKRIDIIFKEEKKSKPKRVEYEAEEWQETKAEIK